MMVVMLVARIASSIIHALVTIIDGLWGPWRTQQQLTLHPNRKKFQVSRLSKTVDSFVYSPKLFVSWQWSSTSALSTNFLLALTQPQQPYSLWPLLCLLTLSFLFFIYYLQVF